MVGLKTYWSLPRIVVMIALFTLSGWSNITAQKIDGFTVVAPPKPFESEPFTRVKQTGADWVCFVPYGYTRMGKTTVHFDSDRQWWGERTSGVKTSIELAREQRLQIMLKPQVYFPGSWPGDMSFDSEEDWAAWEADYRTFILHWAALANDYELELFCVGTEFKQSIRERPQYWHGLIKEIRSIFCGELTYSANWDEYPEITFWNELDYIGISAYFPQLEVDTPDVDDLIKSWQPVKSTLRRFSKEKEMPILFTEFGYLSIDGCCGKTWILEKEARFKHVNETCQANGFDAVLSVFGDEEWWSGGFIWKWFPGGSGHEGYPTRDYTPQDKEAEAVVKKYYEEW